MWELGGGSKNKPFVWKHTKGIQGCEDWRDTLAGEAPLSLGRQNSSCESGMWVGNALLGWRLWGGGDDGTFAKNILYYWLLCKRYFDIHNIYDCLSTTLESIYLENRCQNPRRTKTRPINNNQGCVNLYFYFLVGLRIFEQLNEFAELLILEKCPNLFTITIHPAYWFIGMSALWEESRVPKNRMEKWT